MAVLMVVLSDVDSPPAGGHTGTWAAAAARAHALLSQSLPDDVVDELALRPEAQRLPFQLPVAVAG